MKRKPIVRTIWVKGKPFVQIICAKRKPIAASGVLPGDMSAERENEETI
ncbi:MAG: hypothetical protein LIP12_04145 [Clostridiales bacterium]|nr:hypothetical protein [Clostridiales bacterium]